MSERLGDWKAQSRWLAYVTGAAAGLQFFAVAGPLGEALSEIVQRVVIGYLTIMKHFWGAVSEFLGLQLLPYHHALTFIILVGMPYVIRWRKLAFSPFFQDRNRILAFLNFCAVGFISSNIYRDYREYTGENWLIWISIIPFALIFLFSGIYSYRLDPTHRPTLKIVIVAITLCLALTGIGSIFVEWHKISNIFQPFLTIAINLIESSIYAVGILFRVDGYYPFLVAFLFYITIWLVNFFLVNWIPMLLGTLDSMGV